MGSRIVSASLPFRYNLRLSHHWIPAMDDRQLLRYSRHILLDEIGTEGQQKLLDACVLVRYAIFTGEECNFIVS